MKIPYRQKFFDTVRDSLFKGKLSQSHMDGMNVVLDEWERTKYFDLRWLAYMFGTIFWECAQTMQPIKEKGGDQYFIKRYWDNKEVAKVLGNTSAEDAIKYAGKGFVQLTGRTNYARMGKEIGWDLLNKPELALDPDIAVKIMFEGMINGRFTGKALEDYFDENKEDWYNARRIINGTDKADYISLYSQEFNHALELAK